MRYYISTLVFFILLSFAQKASATSHQQLEDQVVANIIYELPRYITFSHKDSMSLELCIGPDEQIYHLLAENPKKTFFRLNRLGKSNAQCDVIFSSNPKLARKLIKQTAGSAILLLSNYPSFIEEGGNIAIIDANGSIEIVLNLSTARERGISFSPDLLELSTRVIQ